MKKVAVLGVGPAGLMAAYAASLTPNTFVSLFSAGKEDEGPTRSVIGGAQFLHVGLPGLNDQKPDAMLTYLTAGSAAGYQSKVYGDVEVPFVSMSHVLGGKTCEAWSLVKTYDRLWELLIGQGDRANVANINPKWLAELIESKMFDLIISTVPRNSICIAQGWSLQPQHRFASQTIRVWGDAALPQIPDNHICYDGTPNVSWYRTSRIFGVGSTEWSSSAPAKLPYEGEIRKISKPLQTDCNCFNGHVLFTGRYGEWRKGVLTHEAFTATKEALNP